MNEENEAVGPPPDPDIGGVTRAGIETFPPEATVKPGPPPPKEVRESLEGWDRVLALDPEAAAAFVDRLCLTWTMWKRAEDKARALGEELAAAKQDASNQRAIAEKATADAVAARAQLILKGITPGPGTGQPPPVPASSASPDRNAEEEA